MKTNYTASEISEMLGISKRSFLRRCDIKTVHTKKISNPKGGNHQYVYSLTKLPADIQKDILAKEYNCIQEVIPSSSINEEHVKNSIKKWDSAPGWNQSTAKARLLILNTFEQFHKDKKLSLTKAKNRFSYKYKMCEIPGLESWVYDVEKRLSSRKIDRLRSAYRDHGLSGLLTKYGNMKGRTRAITPEIKIFIISHINSKPNIRQSHIYKIIKKTFDQYPSENSIRRFIKKWKKENLQLWAMMEDPRKWKNNMMPSFGNMAANITYFCHTWEMDSTPADIITSDGKRCTIIGAIDVFSRKVILLITPTSKSIAIAACMRKAIFKWGVPDIILKDNGKDYTSYHMEAVTTSLGIETPKLPKYTPEAKPFIERFFGTYTRGIEELLPGYCGHSVPERQALREQATWASKTLKPNTTVEVPLTMKEFQELSDKWLNIYEHSPHHGLKNKTPYQVALESPSQPKKIRDERILDILLAPVSRPRKVGKKAIYVNGIQYHSPELMDHIGKRIELRFDIENAGRVYVFSATKKEYLCQATNEALTGKTLEEYMIAKKQQPKSLREKKKALDFLGLTNRTAAQILLEDELENHTSNVIQFHGEADNSAIREARKAVNSEKNNGSVEVEQLPDIPHKTNPSIDPLDNNLFMNDEDYDRELETLEKWSRKKAIARKHAF